MPRDLFEMRTDYSKESSATKLLVRILVWVAAAVILLCRNEVYGQERPSLSLTPYNYSKSHRQSVCNLQDQIDDPSDEKRLRNALNGMKITTFLAADSRYFYLNEDNSIRRRDPGLIAEILDELADRAGFTWRSSFGILNSTVLPEGKTFADLLDWSVWAYDVSAAYWIKSISRMERGVSFPEGWLDGRTIMVGIEQKEGSKNLDMWSFLEPFSAGVWIMIVVTIAISAAVYFFLDWWDNDSDDLTLHEEPLNNLFLAAISFTGHFEFKPRSNTARLFTVSLAFWSLIMMSAYTANLASFLVIQNTPSIEINTLGDAVRQDYFICVVGTTDADTSLTKAYPGANIIRTKTEDENYQALLDGTCDVALSTVASFNEYRGNKEFNSECTLSWIGRSFKPGTGGFATKSDSGNRCTSLIRDVLNLHLNEMKQQGIINTLWDDHFEKRASIGCDSGADELSGADSGQLSLQAMGGTFIIHYVVTGTAVFIAIFYRCYKENKRFSCRQQKLEEKSYRDNEADSKAVIVNGMNDESMNEQVLQSNFFRQYEGMHERHTEKLSGILSVIEQMMKEANEMNDLVRSKSIDS